MEQSFLLFLSVKKPDTYNEDFWLKLYIKENT